MELKDFITLLTIIGCAITIVTPILKLNSTITQLNTNFKNMIKQDEVRDGTIKEQGIEISKLHDYQTQHELEYKHIEKAVENHEIRINKLENR